MDYPSKIKALEQRSSYFGRWQKEVAESLPGRTTSSMGRYGTPATKTMENTRISSEGKRSIEGPLREHGLESRLNEFSSLLLQRFVQKACSEYTTEIRWFHLHLNLNIFLLAVHWNVQ